MNKVIRKLWLLAWFQASRDSVWQPELSSTAPVQLSPFHRQRHRIAEQPRNLPRVTEQASARVDPIEAGALGLPKRITPKEGMFLSCSLRSLALLAPERSDRWRSDRWRRLCSERVTYLTSFFLSPPSFSKKSCNLAWSIPLEKLCNYFCLTHQMYVFTSSLLSCLPLPLPTPV